MPLFGSRREPTPPTTTSPTTHKSGGLFGRRTSSPHATNNTTTSPTRHSGSGFLHRGTEDHSITTAKNSLMQAEAAEREADRALFAARAAVREARDHVKRLEREAAEEARLAKLKQSQAKALGKKGKMLGRHDHM